MNDTTVLHMLEETNAVMHGHFLLTSGLHSPTYVEKFNVLQQPRYTEALCKEIAARFVNDNVELVVGPMTGGILLAYEVAKNLGTRFFFTERVNGKMTFKRGFHIEPGTRVLIVEDIIDSGNTLSKVREILSLREPKSLAICTLLDKPSRREVNVPVEFVGFAIPDEFVVGYGIDYAQRYRHLPYIGKVTLLDE